jgi:hypothetical protein
MGRKKTMPRAKYIVNRVFFCGRAARTIVGGLFYILSFTQPKYHKTQQQVAMAMNCHIKSIADSYKLWIGTFPSLYDELKAKTIIKDANVK